MQKGEREHFSNRPNFETTMHVRHVKSTRPSWGEQTAGSDTMHASRGDGFSRRSQLNLAFEKSISGCWDMNLRRREDAKHDVFSLLMKSHFQQLSMTEPLY